jgi:hypothetical protein
MRVICAFTSSADYANADTIVASATTGDAEMLAKTVYGISRIPHSVSRIRLLSVNRSIT